MEVCVEGIKRAVEYATRVYDMLENERAGKDDAACGFPQSLREGANESLGLIQDLLSRISKDDAAVDSSISSKEFDPYQEDLDAREETVEFHNPEAGESAIRDNTATEHASMPGPAQTSALVRTTSSALLSPPTVSIALAAAESLPLTSSPAASPKSPAPERTSTESDPVPTQASASPIPVTQPSTRKSTRKKKATTSIEAKIAEVRRNFPEYEDPAFGEDYSQYDEKERRRRLWKALRVKEPRCHYCTEGEAGDGPCGWAYMTCTQCKTAFCSWYFGWL